MGHCSLEKILEQEGLLSYDDNGDYIITDREAAWDKYFEYAENTGFVNKWINNLYRKRLKGKVKMGPVGSFLQAYIGGSMTRKDQETFAFIAEKDPWKLTAQNAGIDIALSPQYYAAVQGTGWAGSFVIDKIPEHVDEVAYGLTGLVIGINLIRMGMAMKFKKSYAAISPESAIINTPTYFKRLKDKIFRPSDPLHD